MLGKVRLALAPYQPNFLFTALYLTPTGFTTSPIPVGLRLIEVQLDIFDRRVVLVSGDGRRQAIAFTELPSIAAIYTTLLDALQAIDVAVTISPTPQELPDRTPLDRDERAPDWVDDDALAWLSAMSSTQAVLDRWRSRFFGRNGLQLWWGALDLSLMLFSGKHVPAPEDRGYLIKYDLDAEMVCTGLYSGDDSTAPFYYAYVYPEPPGCAQIDVAKGASWSEQFREWILPYEDVRQAAQPEQLLRGFLDGVYGVLLEAAHLDPAAFTYVPPPLRHAR